MQMVKMRRKSLSLTPHASVRLARPNRLSATLMAHLRREPEYFFKVGRLTVPLKLGENDVGMV